MHEKKILSSLFAMRHDESSAQSEASKAAMAFSKILASFFPQHQEQNTTFWARKARAAEPNI